MWILIRELHQKPADLAIQCFQKLGILEFSRARISYDRQSLFLYFKNITLVENLYVFLYADKKACISLFSCAD